MHVVFRVGRDNAGVCALFPETITDTGLVNCFHGFHEEQTHYASMLANTRAAEPEEYTPLLHRLTARGCEVRPVKPSAYWQRLARQAQKEAIENHRADQLRKLRKNGPSKAEKQNKKHAG